MTRFYLFSFPADKQSTSGGYFHFTSPPSSIFSVAIIAWQFMVRQTSVKLQKIEIQERERETEKCFIV
jgi:hypothetical protein